MQSAEIVLELDSPSLAERVERSLLPEIPDKLPKTRASLARRGGTLTLTLDCEDVSALRAAVNAYLGLLDTAVSVAKVAEGSAGAAGSAPPAHGGSGPSGGGGTAGGRRLSCPVCRTDMGNEPQALALGAFVVEHGAHRHLLCSSTCRDAFVKRGEGLGARG